MNPSSLISASSTISFAMSFISSLVNSLSPTLTKSHFPGTPFFAAGITFSLMWTDMAVSSKYPSSLIFFISFSNSIIMTGIPFDCAMRPWTWSAVMSTAFSSSASCLIRLSTPPNLALFISLSSGLLPLCSIANPYFSAISLSFLTSSMPI